ncbi:DUF349 domain-containing protein [Candidatus Thiodictyon syntrophicum]|jgi:hypothetical protein|uniref:DUF349 domain-containing protein n=1 Tax=Candidatus Thiodictyon syntrophicum TaxID=1166950 RepID=A0A2K8UEI5_9GAMM|nr:DUF349 domain-containing protein [Candidatus Thiodictyon syntrophicum]AUB83945.1 hypothetical protein THSYN_25440 [Candidatus Thiodictyon syntrophicum]
MLFDRFLKKTRQAIEQRRPPENLLELALGRGDRGVRLDALRRLTSLPHLRAILTDDDDAAVREIAFARYRSLLAGTEGAELSLADRLAELAAVADLRLLEHLAREGTDGPVRRAAIERIASPAVLADCALHDSLTANRGAAVARLEDRQCLEQVVRQIGKKDKAVYRVAREKLRRQLERDEEPRRIAARCADLCERAERLGHLQQWTQDRALLEHLDGQWAQIAAQAEPEWERRYGAARAQFIAAEAAYRAANAAQLAAQESRTALRAARETLIVEAAGIAALDAAAAIRTARDLVAAAWKDLEPLPDAEQRGLDQRFNQHLEAAQTAWQTLTERGRQCERLRNVVARAEQVLKESKPLDLPQTLALIEQGRTLALGLAADASAAQPCAAFSALVERLQARLQGQRRHAEQRLAEIPARLDALAALVEAGELKKADPIHQSLQAALDLIASSGLPKGATADLGARLRALSPRLRDLQHWRRWGADQHREALCAAMEALCGQDLPLAAVAERLHVLKTDWQEVERAGSPANKPLWERFHQASAAVAERVRPLLALQAAEQDSNRAAREQVCGELETFLSRIDWERVEWKRVMRAEREVRHAWSLIGPCEPRERRRLERRYHEAITSMDQRLEAERARNQGLKRGLIERVRTLAEHPDLDAAINETKDLQRQWCTTVPARQRDENRLWQSFRAACDLVFERRAAQHQAQRGELAANLAAREALCDEALACAESQTDPRRLAAAQRDLEQRWREAESIPVPRPAVAALNRRWQEALGRLNQRRQALEDVAGRALFDLLIHRAALCEALEERLLDPAAAPVDPGLGEQEWASLPELPDRGQQEALEERRRAALEAATDPARLAALHDLAVANRERRERLCLELEVAAGVESPPALAQERLRLQVSRLAERMSEGEADSLRGAADLLRAWYLLGPAPRDAALQTRVERVRQALAVGASGGRAAESEAG